MKTLNLMKCPCCSGSFDYRNMKTGVCRNCQDQINEGNDIILIPLSQITSVLIENENLRLGRK